MKISTKPFVFIGIALFLFILYKVGVQKILSTLAKIDLALIIFSLIFLVPAVLMKSYKWMLISKEFGMKMNIWEATKYWLIGLFVGNFTPGRSGDFVRIFYLNNKGLSLGKSLSTVAIDRVSDIISLSILSAIGVLIIMLKFQNSSLTFAVATIFAISAFILLILLKRESTKFFLKPLFNFFMPEKYKEKSREHFHEFFNGIDLLKEKKKTMISVLLISLGAWIIGYVQWYFIFLAFGQNINFIYIATFLPIEVLVSLIPVTISGFGTREVVLISLFGLLGVSAEVSVGFGLVGTLFGVWSIALVGAVLSWKNPIQIKF